MYGIYRRTKDKNGGTAYKGYTMQDGLASNSVKGIVEDNNGMIWIATNNGLSRLNPKTGVFTNYTVDDGLICDQFYWNGAVRSDSGTLYFGTSHGLIEINGYATATAKRGGRPRFTRLVVDNQEVFAGSKYLDHDITTAKSIRLSEQNKSIEIDFSAMDYSPERMAAYSYRLKGFDDKWLQLPPGQHSAHYTNLPSGTYTFEVKYSSGDMHVQPTAASIKIIVAPHFYKNPVFLLLLFAVLAAALLYAYKRHIERMRRHEVDIILEPIRKTLTDTKDANALRQRIQNIIDTKNRYKESYEKTAHNNDKTAPKRVPFMDKIMAILEKNYMSPDFGMQEMSEYIGMSKTLLTKKMKAETGMSPTKFINDYRLSIARKLLENATTNRNITEIAFSVGFNDPKYFTRCFTREYGVAPSKYRKQENNNSDKAN